MKIESYEYEQIKFDLLGFSGTVTQGSDSDGNFKVSFDGSSEREYCLGGMTINKNSKVTLFFLKNRTYDRNKLVGYVNHTTNTYYLKPRSDLKSYILNPIANYARRVTAHSTILDTQEKNLVSVHYDNYSYDFDREFAKGATCKEYGSVFSKELVLLSLTLVAINIYVWHLYHSWGWLIASIFASGLAVLLVSLDIRNSIYNQIVAKELQGIDFEKMFDAIESHMKRA